jgi:hypothetical protein
MAYLCTHNGAGERRRNAVRSKSLVRCRVQVNVNADSLSNISAIDG